MAPIQEFVQVVILGILIAIPVMCGHFDNVNVDIGSEHYAELPWPYLKELTPWMPMPANTLVNLGYFAIGLMWISHINSNQLKWGFTNSDTYYFYSFAWMSILYGVVQSTRIITQNLQVSILDQWYTLPIFSWVCVWCCYILFGRNAFRDFVIVFTSSTSYVLSLFMWYGFELALGCHVILAISLSLFMQCKFNNSNPVRYLILSVLCCCGFVFLKVADHHLPNIHPVFSYLTGHFWSKIADFLQFHYVSRYFADLIKNSRKMEKSH